ncbi:MAG: alpha/beta fold hydrolase [Bacteroidia bacterium]
METRILHFEKAGQGPALFFLHGFLGSLDNWRSIGKRFTETFTVYWVDARNHGKSFWAPSMSYCEQAEDLQRLLVHEGISKAFFVGHSMGGKTLMQLMLSSDVVAGGVVVDISPRGHERGHEPILQALMDLPLRAFTQRQQVDHQLSEKITDAGIRQFLLKSLTRDAQGNLAWRWNLSVLYARYDEILAPVEGGMYAGPVRFLRGAKSNYIRKEEEALIRKLFPKADLVEIPKAGHWVHVDNPDATYQAIREFLDLLRARRDSNPQPPDP